MTIIGTALAVTGTMWALLVKVFKLGKIMQHLSEFEKNVTSELSAIKNKLESLPCKYHHDDIVKVKTVLIQKYPTSMSVFSAKSSPRKLNELGLKLFKAIYGDDFLKKNKDALFQFMDNTRPLVALDVEQAALSACTSLVNTPVFNDMKNYVYNAPSIDLPDGQKYDVTITDVCFVLSIPLRDMYLEEHPRLKS